MKHWITNHIQFISVKLYNNCYSYFTDKNTETWKGQDLTEIKSQWKTEPRANAGLSDFTLNQKANTLHHHDIVPNMGKFLLLCWKSEFTWLIQIQTWKGFHYFSCQQQTPKGLGIKVNCLDFINCLFSSTCHSRLCCPLCTDKPFLTWHRNVFQDKIKKKTITRHKLTALKSFAKVVTPIGLTVAGCRALGTSTFVLCKLLLLTRKKGGKS